MRVFKRGRVTKAIRTYHELAERMADCPILDETDYSNREAGAIPFHITQVTPQSAGNPSWAEVTVGDGLQLRMNPEFCIEPCVFLFVHYGWKNAKPLLHGADGDFEIGGIKCCAWSEGEAVFIDMSQRRAAFRLIGEN